MATTVTLKRPHFETLLRRAELHSSDRDTKNVTIPEVDYNRLLRIAQDFASLKESLYKGGISEDTLEILIRGEGPTYAVEDHASPNPLHNGRSTKLRQHTLNEDSIPGHSELGSLSNFQPASSTSWADEPSQTSNRLRPATSSRQGSFRDDVCFTPDYEREDASIATTRAERPFYARNEQRTILLKGLPERVTHEDIIKVLKGGLILDLYLRTNDRSASVSYVEGSSAQQFLAYARRNDLYIGGKRIEVQWNERQFTLPGHVASKIGIGATRNLIVRNAPSCITDASIRDDLDHIHNLVVISINAREGDTIVELNSIHNAMFARTCMMSRSKYKGLKIDWSPDECSQPIPSFQNQVKREPRSRAPAAKPIAPPNRFQMLNLEGTEDGSSDDEDQPETTLSNFGGLQINPRSPWNSRAIAT